MILKLTISFTIMILSLVALILLYTYPLEANSELYIQETTPALVGQGVAPVTKNVSPTYQDSNSYANCLIYNESTIDIYTDLAERSLNPIEKQHWLDSIKALEDFPQCSPK